MARVRCTVIGSQMAGHARSGSPCKDIVFVARGTLHAAMGAGQWERGRAVIECCPPPGSR